LVKQGRKARLCYHLDHTTPTTTMLS